MHKRNFKALTTLVITSLLLSTYYIGTGGRKVQAVEGTVKIEDYFDDPIFADYVNEKYAGGDGYLTWNERSEVRDLYIYEMGIKSLNGIEVFVGLQNLYAYDNELTEVNLSENINLITIALSDNKITKVKLPYSNTHLENLILSNNNLTTLILRAGLRN